MAGHFETNIEKLIKQSLASFQSYAFNYGEISRTATGEAPLPRIGVPPTLVPQPTMLTTVVLILPLAGATVPPGCKNSCTNPKRVTGMVGGTPGVLLNTGTVTNE